MFNLSKKNYKPIIVFGVARSGTTWLSQTISSAGYELNFEGIATMNYPSDYYLTCKAIPPYYYLKKEDNNPYKKFMDILINCQIRNSAVVKSNKGMPKKVIKLIRANLMIEWIQENYDFYGILLIRNPLAVINSQIKAHMNEGVKDLFEFYPERVLSLFNKEQREYMYKANTRKEILAINWCINYSIPLRFIRFTNIKIIKYEDLFESPIKTIKMLGKFASFKYNKTIKNAINEKSFTIRNETKKIKDYNPRLAWRENFSNEEVSHIINIVRIFKLEEYLDVKSLKQVFN